MPELKTKSVAILYNNNGTCKYVLVATHIDTKEYNKLYNEMLESLQNENAEKFALSQALKTLSDRCDRLENEIKVLKGEEDNE